MKFALVLKPKVKKSLDNLERKEREKIIRILDAIVDNPFLGKKLSGQYVGLYSVRAWPYRIIYEIRLKDLIIFVIGIKNRKDAYR